MTVPKIVIYGIDIQTFAFITIIIWNRGRSRRRIIVISSLYSKVPRHKENDIYKYDSKWQSLACETLVNTNYWF